MSATGGPPAGPPPIPAMDGTLGALAIGSFVSCFFFGITCVQLYLYTQRFPNDRLYYKLLVFWSWLIDAVQTAFTAHVVYFFTVTHYADPTVLTTAPYTLCSMSILEAFVGGPVEIFFAMRVYKLSEGSLVGKIVTGLIVVTAVVHAALGISFSAITYAHPDILYWKTNLEWDSTAGLTCAAVCDVIIAFAMVFFLRSRRTVFAQSKSLVNQLMAYSIESGALTSVCAVAVVITFLTSDSLASLGLLFFLPKLYTNSLMAMLNSRQSMLDASKSSVQVTQDSLRSRPPKWPGSSYNGTDVPLEPTGRYANRPVDYSGGSDYTEDTKVGRYGAV
jgi:hypothetical protein